MLLRFFILSSTEVDPNDKWKNSRDFIDDFNHERKIGFYPS